MQNRIEIENETDALTIVNLLVKNHHRVEVCKDCEGVWIIEFEWTGD